MSVQLVTSPERTLIATTKSKWNSIHHPVVYSFQRMDYTISFITIGSASIFCVLSSTLSITAGATVYVRSGNYDGNYRVISVSGLIVEVAANPNGTSLGGFMNVDAVRENYYLAVKVYIVDEASNTFTLRSERRYYPDRRGVITADVSPALRMHSDLINTCTYTEINEAEGVLSGSFNIVYKEVWIGSANSYNTITDIPRKYYVNAAKQYLDQFGQNMGEHVPSLDGNYAKFLGAFVRPTIFPGFPFAQSVILSELIGGKQITRELEFKDVNGTVNDDYSDVLNNDQFHNSRVNHITINTGSARNVITPADQFVDLWLECDPDVVYELDYFEPDYFTADYYRGEPADIPPPFNPIE